jgi:arylsulfatase A-like enzyme
VQGQSWGGAGYMKSRKRLSFLCAVLVIESLLAAYWQREVLGGAPAVRRHVLLVTVDTLRADYLSSYGYDRPTTPFLDSLIAKGVRFTRAITPIARTTPALSSLMTGSYPHTNTVRNLVDRLPSDIVPVAELARRKGYTTVAVVSNNVLQDRGLDRGFDVYDIAPRARDAAHTTDAVLRHLHPYSADDALFVWVHYMDPHIPYNPPAPLSIQFDPDYEGPYKFYFGDLRHGIVHGAYPADLAKEQAVYENPLPDRVNAHVRRLYAAEIRSTDDHIARLVKGLRKQFGDDWLIVFTADHGESLGEHAYFYDHGDYVSDPELHVPLAFAFPFTEPLHPRRTIETPVSLVDVMPTLVELLELPPPRSPDYAAEGRSLLPAVLGQPLPPRAVFAESGKNEFHDLIRRRVRFDVSGRFRAAMMDDWKLVWTPGRTGADQFELYNLKTDPQEADNVYVSHQAAAVPLKAALATWSCSFKNESTPTNQVALSERDSEILRSLGYIR